MPLSPLLTLKLREAAAGAWEAAIEEALEKTVVKKLTALQLREAEKRVCNEGMHRGSARGKKGWGDTAATAKNDGLLS